MVQVINSFLFHRPRRALTTAGVEHSTNVCKCVTGYGRNTADHLSGRVESSSEAGFLCYCRPPRRIFNANIFHVAAPF